MISAILLAAGQSKRMGQPKMLLPWGNVTVIEHVIGTFLRAGLEDILVVTGGSSVQMQDLLARLPVRTVYNEVHATGEMLSSLQRGIRELPDKAGAVLIGLGDQPQAEESSIRAICEAYRTGPSSLIVPSFQMRRGHPWLAARSLWKEILELGPPQTPRDFLHRHANDIHYVNLDTPTILADLDTWEDYRRSHP